MDMLTYVILCIHCIFFSVPRCGETGLYPDAITNALHGYAELDKHTDKEIDHIHEVKATTTKTEHHWADKDYEDEDLFFHALVHNNDDDDSQVENVSSKQTSTGRFDCDLFEKLNEKLFHHDVDTADEHPKEAKVSRDLHLHDVLEDEEFFALE